MPLDDMPFDYRKSERSADNLLVSDWNGTLTSASEADSNKYIGYSMLADAKKRLMHGDVRAAGTLGKLLIAKKLTERNLREYNEGTRPLSDVYEPFNFALKGNDAEYVRRLAREFAIKSADKVDTRVLEPMREWYRTKGLTAILSVAHNFVIKETLKASGYIDILPNTANNGIIANMMQTEKSADGAERALGLTLDIYGKKAKIFEDEFLRLHNYPAARSFYMGDTSDDEPVAELLPKGHFIVPLLASRDFAQCMAQKYGAFVPENKWDLEAYLRSV